MADLKILQDIAAGEPARETEARWRRRWSQRCLVLLSGLGAALVLATVALSIRSHDAGVTRSEAACPSSASSAPCARAVAAIFTPSVSAQTRTGALRIAVSVFPGPTASRAEIYTMNSRGRDFRLLTKGPGWATSPAWSPDGTRIAFDWRAEGDSNLRDAANGIYLTNPDGSGRTLLVHAPWTYPAWSPAGSKIAFWMYDGHGKPGGIYLVDRNGGGLQRITSRGWSPSWSPDGTKIAYTKDNQIYVMNSDGTGQRLLGGGYFPAWSPDGKKIAFLKFKQSGAHTVPVWIMNADGSNKRPLHFRSWVDCELKWSPGGQLAVSNPAGLFLLRPLGDRVTILSGAHICGIAWPGDRRPPDRPSDKRVLRGSQAGDRLGTSLGDMCRAIGSIEGDSRQVVTTRSNLGMCRKSSTESGLERPGRPGPQSPW